MAEKYEFLFNKKAKITAIHAGLECGILRDKIGPIDAVSFGPSVETFWSLLKEVLKAL